MCTGLDIAPQDTMKEIRKELNQIYFKNSSPEEYTNTRASLIDLVKDYIIEYSYSTRTYFLTIFIIDYLHANHSYKDVISRLKPDLLVLGSFLIAVKFLEDDAYPPSLDTFPSKKNPNLYYALNEVRKYEGIIIILMNFKLDYFTSYYLLETILSHGVVFTNELTSIELSDKKACKDKLKRLYKLAIDINKLFIEDITSLEYDMFEIAATCVVMSKELMKFEVSWNPELEKLYSLDLNSLSNCYNAILK
jgi:hypothetical protein